MRRLDSFYRWLAVSFACLLLAFAFGGPVAFAASQESIDQSVTQAYGTDNAIQKGMIVKLKDGDTHKVVPLDKDHPDDMLGVVVAPNDSAVTLTNDNSETRQAYVATFGRFDVLVSNENGTIKPGDYITISSVDGIGALANDTDSIVLGKANEGFNGTSNVVSSTSIKRADGSKRGVSIGRIAVTVNISHNPLQKSDTSSLPGFFQHIGNEIADKPVSPTRIYLALAVLIICTILAGSLLYSGVRSSMISIGRNPLAKKSILRSMLQVILTSLTVFIIGIFGVYLLIRL